MKIVCDNAGEVIPLADVRPGVPVKFAVGGRLVMRVFSVGAVKADGLYTGHVMVVDLISGEVFTMHPTFEVVILKKAVLHYEG